MTDSNLSRLKVGGGLIRRFRIGAIWVILSATAFFAVSAAAAENDKVELLKALKIDSGTITLVEYHEFPPATAAPDDKFSKLPARTVVKMVLNPAKGSSIRVEVWLPEADEWNGRQDRTGHSALPVPDKDRLYRRSRIEAG